MITKRTARLLAAASLALLAPLVAPDAARAADPASTYTVQAALNQDGSLVVESDIVVAGSPAALTQTFGLQDDVDRTQVRRFTLSDVTASVDGAPVQPTVTKDATTETISVPLGKPGTVKLGYKVTGASWTVGDGITTTQWRFLQGLNIPIATFDAQVQAPGFPQLACVAGEAANPGPCGYFGGGTHEARVPTFHHTDLAPGQIVGVSLRSNASVVASDEQRAHLWSLDRAFTIAPLELLAAALVALLGGLAYWFGVRRLGRDAAASAPTPLAWFSPVGEGQSAFETADDLRPAEAGTLIDERVDPIDVTASVLDLAVRGHLLITELPRASAFAPTEWALSRVQSAAGLLPYERAILDAVAPADGEPRPLSEGAPALVASLGAIQDELYDEVVRKGWFATRPDRVRGRWSRIGWIALAIAAVLAVLLIAFTTFGGVAVVLLVLAALLGTLSSTMPARTAKGASALAGLGVLRGTLLTQPTNQLPRGREHAELGGVLPYAVVLGGSDRWLDAIAAHDDVDVPDETELPWYHGPSGWKLTDLPDSLRNFIRSLQGTLITR